MLQAALGVLNVVLVIAFSVALGIGMFVIVQNYLLRNAPEPRTQNRSTDDTTLRTAALVQELYDEYIGRGAA